MASSISPPCRRSDVHDDTKIIDLTFDFDEQKQFFVRRIDFSGNTTTRDKVIRRELLLNEGDIFNNRYWELSLLRLNQLDYFDAIKPENAEIKRNTKQGTVDILLKLKEKGKQSISLTGGVSGFAGSFIGLTYQTNNFLGLGETLTLSGQIGTFSAALSVRFHRALSVRPADFHRIHHLHEPVQLQSVAADVAAAGPEDSDQSQYRAGLQPEHHRLHRLRQLSAAAIFLRAAGPDLRLFGYQHSIVQHRLDRLVRGFAIPVAGRPFGAQRHPLQQDHADVTYNTVNNPINPTTGNRFSIPSVLKGSAET